MDPFSLSTGVVGLVALVLKLVVGALGMIDKTIAAYDEATNELKGLQKDLEQLQAQMVRIHGTLTVLASNTKDPGFTKLLRDEKGQIALRELCDALEETFNTLTQMTDKTTSNESRPASLPSNKKSLEFTQAVLRHSLMPSKIADLVKALREMRSDVQICLTKLETTFQHVNTLYNIMNNGLARIVSRTSIFSTSTNLTIRIKLYNWLKRREKTWGLSNRHNTTSLHDRLQDDSSIETSRMTSDLLAETFYQSSDEDKDAQQGRLIGFAPQSFDDPDTPPPEVVDIAGRRRFADFIRRAGTILDPDPERYNNRVYTQGRYRTYPRTPGEDLLNPKLIEHERRFYQARAGPSRSQIDLVTPSGPDGRDSHAEASASGSQTPFGDSNAKA